MDTSVEEKREDVHDKTKTENMWTGRRLPVRKLLVDEDDSRVPVLG